MQKRIIYLFGFLVLTVNGIAQDKLSLTDAIQIGLKTNYQIQISGKDIQIAKRNNNWLEAGALPSITVDAGQDFNWSQTDNPTSFLDGNFNSNSTSAAADLNWVLFNGFRVKITKGKLQQLQEQSEGNAAVIVENTIQSIVLGYYNVLLQKEKLNALAKVLSVSSDRFKYVGAKRELGSASTFDVLLVKNDLLTDSTNYLLQELAYNNTRRNLNMLMAVDVEKQYELTDKLQLEKKEYDIEELKSKMLSNNQTLKNQYINQNILKKDRGLAKADLFPVISFGSGLSNSVGGSEFRGVTSNGNTNFSYYAKLSLTFTLFNGNKAHRTFGNMKINETIAQLTTDEMKLTLTNELISAYELYNARVAILSLTNESLEIAELNFKVAKEKYEGGSISSFEFRDIQTSYLNTVATQVEASYNAIDTHTDLTRLTGGIIDEYGTVGAN